MVAAQQLAGLHGITVGPQFGPTDCTVLADDTADPGLPAADLLTESEHGRAPRLIPITWQPNVAEAFAAEIEADEEPTAIWQRCGTTVLCQDEAAARARERSHSAVTGEAYRRTVVISCIGAPDQEAPLPADRPARGLRGVPPPRAHPARARPRRTD